MNQKRNTLKKVTSISAVVALTPMSWTKPIVRSVLLPAHAQTSVVCPSNFTVEVSPISNFEYNLNLTTGDLVTDSRSQTIMVTNVSTENVTVTLVSDPISGSMGGTSALSFSKNNFTLMPNEQKDLIVTSQVTDVVFCFSIPGGLGSEYIEHILSIESVSETMCTSSFTVGVGVFNNGSCMIP